MSRPGTDEHVRDTTTTTTASDNAAKRHAKALARQRKAQQHRAALDHGRAKRSPRKDAVASVEEAQPAAEEPQPVEGALTIDEAPPAGKALVVDEAPPAEEALVVEEAPPAGKAPVVEEAPHVEGALAVEDISIEDLFREDLPPTDVVELPTPAPHSITREVDQPRRPRRARRRSRPALRRIAGLGVLFVVGIIAWQSFLSSPQAQVTLDATGPGTSGVLVVEAGAIDLAGLAQQAQIVGRPNALQQVGVNAYLLSMPVTVGPGGHLALGGAELRLLSQPGSFVGLEARGGELTLQDATVTSWDPTTGGPDTNVTDGRAYVLARDGGRLDVVGSSATMLGYDAYERYGVSWRTAGTGGVIDRSTFSGNFYGAYMNGVDPMTITDSVIENSVSYGLDPHSESRDFTIVGNTFRNNGKHGMILAEDCTGAEIRDNDAYGNAEHGIVVFAGSDDVVVEGNRVRENGAAGISVNGSTRVALRNNDVWANTTGVTVQDGATKARIEGNRLSNNREDGILVSSEQSTATVVANRIDHNGRAGLWVNGGQATVGPDNRISDNESGVRLVDETPSVRVFDNLLNQNYKDGLSLVVEDGLSITGNRIEENEVAFSVRTAGLATPFLDANTLIDNELGPERVRVADPEPAPVP